MISWNSVYAVFAVWFVIYVADACGLFERFGEWNRQRKIRKAMRKSMKDGDR